MADAYKQSCDEGVIRSGQAAPCEKNAKPLVLAATILGSSMVFINASTINVELPALQTALSASVVDMQWVVNAYTLFLAALILLSENVVSVAPDGPLYIRGNVALNNAKGRTYPHRHQRRPVPLRRVGAQALLRRQPQQSRVSRHGLTR